jgi:hypothetical protein
MGEKYHIIIIYDGGGKVIYHVNLNYLSRGDNIVPKFPTWTKYMLKSFLMENKMEEGVNSTLTTLPCVVITSMKKGVKSAAEPLIRTIRTILDKFNFSVIVRCIFSNPSTTNFRPHLYP